MNSKKTTELSELPKLVEKQNAESVVAILRRIEEKQDLILLHLEELGSKPKPAPKPRVHNLAEEVEAVLVAAMNPGEHYHFMELTKLANNSTEPALPVPITDSPMSNHALALSKKGTLIRIRESVYALPVKEGDQQ